MANATPKYYTEYSEKIKQIAQKAKSETELQTKLEAILTQMLLDHEIEYTPINDVALKEIGLSQTSSGRPDSLFGHIILDYKAPGEINKNFKKHSRQIERYLNDVVGKPSKCNSDTARWVGILWDGLHLAFCRESDSKWSWSLYESSHASIKTLIHFYRSLHRKPLTSELLASSFGKNSETAQKVIPAFVKGIQSPNQRTKMLFKEWKRLFKQVSTYELSQIPSITKWASELNIKTKDSAELLFATHTYYSIIVKSLSIELLFSIFAETTNSLIEEIANCSTHDKVFKLSQDLEDNQHYRQYRITNFLEGDFFSWYSTSHNDYIAEAIQQISRTITEFEPSTNILKPHLIKDILKEFYTSLLDEQIRHDLGEYYTPDWLAQLTLDEVGYSGQIGSCILDPTCGSGTFLVEAISRLRKNCKAKKLDPKETLEHITSSVKGMDLNPLAVISARVNYILSISDLVLNSYNPIELPVYLADSINVPIPDKNNAHDLVYTLYTELGNYELKIPDIFIQTQLLSKVLEYCEKAIISKSNKNIFIQQIKLDEKISPILTDDITCKLEDLFEIIQHLEDKEWDKVWCRIINNNFAPKGFKQFDFIVGNPPWVRWSRLPELYRENAKYFCDYYGLVSGRGYTGGIESDISTVITYSAVDNWLKTNGKIGFLITFPVFKSASAKGFRVGRLPDGKGIEFSKIHDMSKIQPFPDSTNETSLFIAKKISDATKAFFKSIECKKWECTPQRIPANVKADDILTRVNIEDEIAAPVAEWGSPLFTGPKNIFDACKHFEGASDYLNDCHRGTVTDASRIFWLKVLQYSKKDNLAKIKTLTDNELPRARHFGSPITAWVEADLLYPIIRGRECGRYSTKNGGLYQLIPNNHYSSVIEEAEFAAQYPLAFEFLAKYRTYLEQRSTYRRYQSHLPFYSIYCIGDYSFNKYKVIWPEQQAPLKFRASVISTVKSQIPNNIIVPDHKIYYVSTKTEIEANYICAILNSPVIRKWFGGFLLGKQIGTRVLEHLRIPKFDKTNDVHTKLAQISKSAHSVRMHSINSDLLSHKKENELKNLTLQLFQ